MYRVLKLPPVLPAVFVAAGVVVHYAVWRFGVLPSPVNYVVGIALLVIAVAVFLWAFWSFRRRGEDLAVHVPTQRIVMDGAYEWGRNPVYVAFMLLILGLGCSLNALAVVLAVVPAFVWLNWYVVPREEARLRANLSEEYERYTRRTHRWA